MNVVPNWAPSVVCSASKCVAFIFGFRSIFTSCHPGCCKVDFPGFYAYNIHNRLVFTWRNGASRLWKLLEAASAVASAMMLLLQEKLSSSFHTSSALQFLILCACVGRRRARPSSVIGTPRNQELGAGNAILWWISAWHVTSAGRAEEDDRGTRLYLLCS